MSTHPPTVEIDDSQVERFDHSGSAPSWTIQQRDGSVVRTVMANGLDVSVLTDSDGRDALVLYLRLGDYGLHCEFTAEEARITAAGMLRAAAALGGGRLQ